MNLSRRILLPAGHLAVDCLALAFWLWHANTLYQPRVGSLRTRVETVAFFQEGGAVQFQPSFEPHELLFLGAGNLPAMIVSGTLRPDGLWASFKKRWDPAWFSIHEGISLSFWFGIGALLESGGLRIRKLMVGFLAARSSIVAFLFLPEIANIGARLEVLCWLAFGVYVLAVALRWAFCKLQLA
jgi:hypothetical protein